MAKETKKVAAPAAEKPVQKSEITTVTEETIENQIKSENKMDDKALTEALDLIQKEKDEKKAYTLKVCICKADYVNKRELIALRKRRTEEKATKTALEFSKEALDKLKTGLITPDEYEKELEKCDCEKRKAFSKIEESNSELIKELRNNYPSYYSYDWEYERRCNRY